ncbi:MULTISPECIES: arginase [unclassified Blautia]|uniref:arginase n=1 Tax=unclassified Blautia TaxID=2648079 RepID=UPI0025BDB05C|nr:arginase [Blautia sp.]MCI7449732.1 arginase [Blautia sp.]MDD6415080.1 arginase [Blautia sp.]MDY4114905.1 arginase [Blautia sp.]
MQKQTSIVLMNFSGIYREEEFWKNRQVSWIEVQDICGTNCYCDDEAIAEINKRTESHSVAGIHFIDSGNYHYMTRLWMARMEKPFCLLVYDNHTDMQLPAFGGILSCGGWIAAALEEVEKLEHVILIGPDEAAYEQVDETLKRKVTFLSREKLQGMNDEEINSFLKASVCEACNWTRGEGIYADFEKPLPLYISIDKDVLCTEDAQTTWSQGDMHLTTLLSGIQTVIECAKENGRSIAGVDICGEADAEAAHENESNDFANEKLLEVFDGLFGKRNGLDIKIPPPQAIFNEV